VAQCLLPLVHSLDHRPDHSHGPERVPWDESFPLQEHAALHQHAIEHSHDADATPDHPIPASERPAPPGSVPEHGAWSLLHFGAAVQPSALVQQPSPSTWPDFVEPAGHAVAPDLLVLRTRDSRGPPVIEPA
jgi:hypothetical protein